MLFNLSQLPITFHYYEKLIALFQILCILELILILSSLRAPCARYIDLFSSVFLGFLRIYYLLEIYGIFEELC